MSEEPISAAIIGLGSLLGMGGAGGLGAGALGAGTAATGAGLGTAAGTAATGAGLGTAAGTAATGAGLGTAAGLGAGAAGAGGAMMPIIGSAGSTAMGPALEAILASGAAPAGESIFASMLPLAKDMGIDMAKNMAMQTTMGLLGGKQPPPAQSDGVAVPAPAAQAAPYQAPPMPDTSAILQLLLRGIYPPGGGGSEN